MLATGEIALVLPSLKVTKEKWRHISPSTVYGHFPLRAYSVPADTPIQTFYQAIGRPAKHGTRDRKFTLASRDGGSFASGKLIPMSSGVTPIRECPTVPN
jgi:hypothetical protein